MNNQKNGRGKAIIISIAVLLLVGLIGYVAWLNFFADDATDESTSSQQDTTSQSTDDSTADTQADDNKSYVVLADWGVGFGTPLDGTTIQWAKLSDDTSGGNAIGFTTGNLTASDTCKPENGAAGTLQRSKEAISTDTVGTMVSLVADGKAIGEYYYAFSLPNGQHCEDQNPSDYEEAVRIGELVQTLKTV